MRRRDVLLAAAAVVGLRAAAQEAPRSAHIGFIVTDKAYPRHWFEEAMRRLGWIEGRNLFVEGRVTGMDPERRKIAAAELGAANPDAIVAAGVLDALPVRAQTRTIPIVVINGADLIEEGLADSLARPGGNITGIVVLRAELDSKRLELLHELLPAATLISYLAYARRPRSVARTTAVEPEVVLMDEPCSALDPIATAKIEELIHELKQRYTIVIVTHNMQQAARVSDFTAFLYLGRLVEFGRTDKLFTAPEKQETEDYITGRFG